MELDVNLDIGESSLVLSSAILLYASEQKRGEVKYASIHPVMMSQTGSPEILAGEPLTKKGIEEALSSLNKAQLGDEYFGFIPENVLSASAKHLVWWRPAQESRIYFDCKELGKRSNVTSQPALVFAVVRISGELSWYVWAIKDLGRPTSNSALYRAPYFNVYDNGGICQGSAKTPRGLTPGSIQQWERAFFDSSFTHANGTAKRTSYKDGDYAFWKQMLDGTFKAFPGDILIEEKSDIAAILDAIKKRLK